jgi:hypothetical protein
MATNSLVDIKKLSPKFQDLYAKTKDFVEVSEGGDELLADTHDSYLFHRMTAFLPKSSLTYKWVKERTAGR